MSVNNWLPPETERAAALLEAHPCYHVLRALPPLDRLPLGAPRGNVRKAVVLDTETTSLDYQTGKIIELAICPIEFDAFGQIVFIGNTVDWLQDPGEPLTEEISRLTHLSDADLAGQRIDDEAAVELLLSASVIVAHNSSFDVKWVEKRYPEISGKPWACSLRDIPWADHDIESRKLGPLLAEVTGWFNARHRANADVDALVALLASNLPSGQGVFEALVRTASRPTVRIRATNSPFNARDALKGRQYRWDQARRVWTREVPEDALTEELAWLAAHAQCPRPDVQTITWHQRHR